MFMDKETDDRLTFTILMAEDDHDDQNSAREAFEAAKLVNELHIVEDGQELIDYLTFANGYTEENAPRPGLILLDLKMPRKDGREALAEIKADPKLRTIPVVILTASEKDERKCRGDDLDAAGYIAKPISYRGLVDLVGSLAGYWIELVALPGKSFGSAVTQNPRDKRAAA